MMLGYGKIMRSFCANTEKFWRKISKNGSDRSAGALPEPPEPREWYSEAGRITHRD
jgi:hypothetical protein